MVVDFCGLKNDVWVNLYYYPPNESLLYCVGPIGLSGYLLLVLWFGNLDPPTLNGIFWGWDGAFGKDILVTGGLLCWQMGGAFGK